ncbi:MAG: Hsp20/alpha crystallin family protein [Truepera sp.]|nr:Hsp20/alpha crystallin family protein [Truepera sp.]
MLQSWNPWQELEEFQRRLSRAVNSREQEGSLWAPATDIIEDTDGLHLYLDLPGVDQSTLEVTTEQNTLTVKATRTYSKKEGQTVHHQGRPQGTFTRTFNIPSSFDFSKVSARFTDGVLSVLVPRSESTKPRKIEVSVSQ